MRGNIYEKEKIEDCEEKKRIVTPTPKKTPLKAGEQGGE